MWLDILYLWLPLTVPDSSWQFLTVPDSSWEFVIVPDHSSLRAGSKLQLFCFVKTHVSQYVRPLEDNLERSRRGIQHCAMHQEPLEQAPSVCCCLHLMCSAASRSFVVCPLNFANYKNFAAVCNLWSYFRNAWIKNSWRHHSRKIFRLALWNGLWKDWVNESRWDLSAFSDSGFKCYSLSALLRS